MDGSVFAMDLGMIYGCAFVSARTGEYIFGCTVGGEGIGSIGRFS